MSKNLLEGLLITKKSSQNGTVNQKEMNKNIFGRHTKKKNTSLGDSWSLTTHMKRFFQFKWEGLWSKRLHCGCQQLFVVQGRTPKNLWQLQYSLKHHGSYSQKYGWQAGSKWIRFWRCWLFFFLELGSAMRTLFFVDLVCHLLKWKERRQCGGSAANTKNNQQ